MEKLLKKQDKIEDDVVIHDDVISMIGKNVETLKFLKCSSEDSDSESPPEENEDQKMIREKRQEVDEKLVFILKRYCCMPNFLIRVLTVYRS